MRCDLATLVLVIGLQFSLPALADGYKLPPWEKPNHVGRALYRENCIVCHDVEKSKTLKLGPSLFRLFQNEKLPFSGGKPNEDYVRTKIQFGGDVMPPYVNRLTAEEIGEIISYIRTNQ